MQRSLRKTLPWHMLPAILALAWPTMLEQLMHTAVQYIDVAMVGSLGTQATAAVGATSTVNWLVSSTISAVGVGFLAYISQACGAGDMTRAKKASAQSVFAVLVLGALVTSSFFTVLCCFGRPRLFLALFCVRQATRKPQCGWAFLSTLSMYFLISF